MPKVFICYRREDNAFAVISGLNTSQNHRIKTRHAWH
jgi:hypothetical protein